MSKKWRGRRLGRLVCFLLVSLFWALSFPFFWGDARHRTLTTLRGGGSDTHISLMMAEVSTAVFSLSTPLCLSVCPLLKLDGSVPVVRLWCNFHFRHLHHVRCDVFSLRTAACPRRSLRRDSNFFSRNEYNRLILFALGLRLGTHADFHKVYTALFLDIEFLFCFVCLGIFDIAPFLEPCHPWIARLTLLRWWPNSKSQTKLKNGS